MLDPFPDLWFWLATAVASTSAGDAGYLLSLDKGPETNLKMLAYSGYHMDSQGKNILTCFNVKLIGPTNVDYSGPNAQS